MSFGTRNEDLPSHKNCKWIRTFRHDIVLPNSVRSEEKQIPVVLVLLGGEVYMLISCNGPFVIDYNIIPLNECEALTVAKFADWVESEREVEEAARNLVSFKNKYKHTSLPLSSGVMYLK